MKKVEENVVVFPTLEKKKTGNLQKVDANTGPVRHQSQFLFLILVY